jgi:transcriptional regulator with XRE-family HTH domain
MSIGERIRNRRTHRKWSIRHAAGRAGLAPSTWSRIERGLMSVDNRYTLADIATALECSTADLTGQPAANSGDPDLFVAHTRVVDILGILMDTSLDEPPTGQARPIAEIEAELDLVRDLYRRCDYAAITAYLPRLLADLHAYALHGSGAAHALRMLAYLTHATALVLRDLGYPSDSWTAAERCREIAEELDDPTALGVAAFTRSIAAIGCTGHQRAATLATRASVAIDAHLATPDAMPVAGMLHLGSAMSLIGAKRPGDAAEHLHQAQELAERTGETTFWDLMFGPTNVAFWRVSLGVDAGDPGEAVEIALNTNPGSLSDARGRQVSFYTDTARGLARLGRDEDATRYLLTAERLAPQRVRSAPLIQETARGIRERANRTSAIVGLCERMGLPA